MNDEIDIINRYLPNTPHPHKTTLIGQWMERVIQRIEHFKSEHYALLKNNMTQLELALWKNELEKTTKDDDGAEGHSLDEKQPAKKAKICEHGEASTKTLQTKEETISVDTSRQKARVTVGQTLSSLMFCLSSMMLMSFLYSIKMHSKRFLNSEIGSKYSF